LETTDVRFGRNADYRDLKLAFAEDVTNRAVSKRAEAMSVLKPRVRVITVTYILLTFRTVGRMA
jgi:hypothetical protein